MPSLRRCGFANRSISVTTGGLPGGALGESAVASCGSPHAIRSGPAPQCSVSVMRTIRAHAMVPAARAAGPSPAQRAANRANLRREEAARDHADQAKYLGDRIAEVDSAQQGLDRLFAVYFTYLATGANGENHDDRQLLPNVIEAAGNLQTKVANMGDRKLAVAAENHVRMVRKSLMKLTNWAESADQVDASTAELRSLLAEKRASYLINARETKNQL